MQQFEVCILGCSSATPTSNRNPTSQFISIADRHFLIDCGEGTQMQIRKFKLKLQKIDHILISHLHGDHYFGLIGLLASMHLLGRKEEINLYGPPGLKEIIELQNKHSDTRLNYKLVYHIIPSDAASIIFEDEKVIVKTIILNHRVPCTGFLIKEKSKGKHLDRQKVLELNIARSEFPRIKLGDSFVTNEGLIISNDELTVSIPTYTYAYCSDTCYDERVINQIESVDVLYHEATFLHNLVERAKETFHSTAKQAGQVALSANVGHLIIGHFSARYADLTPLLEDAQSVFPNTSLAEEGRKFFVPYHV